MSFDVLVVCTGNICRSPMAERLLYARTAAGADVVVSSAGTGALVGYAMDEPSAAVLRELGGNPDGHVARRLTESMIERADLVLTAEAAHRSAVLAATPVAFRRTFTLLEFARLARLEPNEPADADASLPGLVRAIAACRGTAPAVDPRLDDIEDPYRRKSDAARRVGVQISEAIDVVVQALQLAT